MGPPRWPEEEKSHLGSCRVKRVDLVDRQWLVNSSVEPKLCEFCSFVGKFSTQMEQGVQQRRFCIGKQAHYRASTWERQDIPAM